VAAEPHLLLRFGDKTMSEKSKRAHDAFTFSLGGIRVISSFAVAPIIAHDLINIARDARLRDNREDQPGWPQEYPGIKGRFWLLGRRRAA
jgi:hypothetical protein